MVYYDTKRFRAEMQEEFHITFFTDDSKMKAYAKEKLWRQVSDYFMDFVKTYPNAIWTMKIEDEYVFVGNNLQGFHTASSHSMCPHDKVRKT